MSTESEDSVTLALKDSLSLPSPASVEMVEEIKGLHGQLMGFARKSVVLIVEIGRRLSTVKASLNHGQFLPWVAENCPFSERTARNYLSVFEQFKSATLADLENQTVAEAYITAGVKKILEPALEAPNGTEASDDRPELITAGDLDAQRRARIAAIFQVKPLAADLHRYRIVVDESEVHIYNGFSDVPAMGGQFYVPQPDTEVARKALFNFKEELQATYERYQKSLEELEDQGVIESAADLFKPEPVIVPKAVKTRQRPKNEVLHGRFEDAVAMKPTMGKRNKKGQAS